MQSGTIRTVVGKGGDGQACHVLTLTRGEEPTRRAAAIQNPSFDEVAKTCYTGANPPGLRWRGRPR